MGSSTRARNRSSKPEKEGPKASDSLYKSAVIMCDPTAVSRPRKWKHRAKSLLRQCTTSTPRLAKAHALLAYIHFLSEDYAAAEMSIRRTLRFEANNGVYLRLLLSVLLAQDKDTLCSRWLLKLSKLEGVDLTNLRLQLRRANFPADTYTLVQNAFPNAIGWFESYLLDEVEQIQLEERDKSSIDFELDQEIDRFRPKKIDARKVPRELRSLIPVALEWGIGDDAARGSFVDRASTEQKRQLRRMLSIKARRRINDWLDLFADGAVMTDEAACFMYLLEAYEEVTN
ncbi:MAG: hypothetical protein ACYTBV_08970 [Planctomycetota bacterium]